MITSGGIKFALSVTIGVAAPVGLFLLGTHFPTWFGPALMAIGIFCFVTAVVHARLGR